MKENAEQGTPTMTSNCWISMVKVRNTITQPRGNLERVHSHRAEEIVSSPKQDNKLKSQNQHLGSRNHLKENYLKGHQDTSII